jgi:hypothetical protein
MEVKTRKGYSHHGYPIVWLRNNSHEECMKKLKERELEPVSVNDIETEEVLAQRERKFIISGQEFIIGMDQRQYILKYNNKVTYYTDFDILLKNIKNCLLKKELKNDNGIINIDSILSINEKVNNDLTDFVKKENFINFRNVKQDD